MLYKKTGVLLLIIYLSAHFSEGYGQQVFDRQVTETGNIGLSINNVGSLGKPDVRNNPSGVPSFEFPLNSGQEHLFEAGIWVGAIRDGAELLVSTAAITDPAGFATGKEGFEFTNDGTPIRQQSNLASVAEQLDIVFRNDAISHQDIIAEFSDSRTSIQTGTSSIPISGHEQPLDVDIKLTSLNWNFSFTESFSILKYEITNNSNADWDSVYVGMYADLINRNVNSSIETGSNFFNKNGIGFLDSLFTTYVFDAGSTDQPSINTYGGLSIIGSEYRGNLFHPSNADFLQAQGIRPPDVGPSYWLFTSGAGDFRGPVDDVERYNRMRDEFPLEENRETLRTGGQSSQGNFISMISIGPFPKIEAGETATVFFALTGGLKPEDFQGVSQKRVDNEETRVNFVDNLEAVFRTFRGEDRNGNGQLDPEEDLNDNNQLDRFLIPEPPSIPNMRVESNSGEATIFWDRSAEQSIDPVSGLQDFEGYRIYRSELGADLEGAIGQNPQMIRQFDLLNNDAGFNTGFSEVRLDEPVTFPGDPVEYNFKFEVEGLLSGWQYLFSVTAFDQGNPAEGVPPLESSVIANSVRVFPGTPVNERFESEAEEFEVGVYPNPYRVNAAWDGNTNLNRKIIFYNLPERAQIRVYTLSGNIIAELDHEAGVNNGNIRWFNDFSTDDRIMAGGEHAWDMLSDANQNLSSGLYIYSVKDLDSGEVQTGKLAIIF